MRLAKSIAMSLFIAFPLLTSSCSTDSQQEEIQEEVFQEEGEFEDEEMNENFNSDMNGEGNNFGNAGFNNTVNNQFFNNETNPVGNLPADEGFGGEGDMQQVMEEMNTGNVGQFGEETGNFANNPVLAPDQGFAEQVPAGDFVNQAANSALDQAAMPAPMAGATGSPLAPGLPELGSKMSYMVQRGDTLGKIASKVYGDPSKWTEIADFTGIANPRLIYPGDVVYYQLTEQTMSFASNYESTARSEVIVSAGDTLSTIASRVLGDANNWKLIWRHNDNISNPDRLEAGSVIYYVSPNQMAAVDTDLDSEKIAQQTIELDNSVQLLAKAQSIDEAGADLGADDYDVNSANEFYTFI